MKGCPYCSEVKEILNEEGIKFIEKDIDVYSKEYDQFVKETNNDYLPAFLIITKDEEGMFVDVKSIVPDTDFQELTEAVEKIKNHISK